MEMLNKCIENDNLQEDRNNLRKVNEFTADKLRRQFEREIEMAEHNRLDELHIKFGNENELSFEEVLLVKRVFDFLKTSN